MKFGLFLMPEPFPWSNWTLSYDLKLEEIVYAERFGYDEVWVGEHHTGAYENIPAPDIFIAKASALTSRIGLGTGTINLPYHDPFMVAERHGVPRPPHPRPPDLRLRRRRAGQRQAVLPGGRRGVAAHARGARHHRAAVLDHRLRRLRRQVLAARPQAHPGAARTRSTRSSRSRGCRARTTSSCAASAGTPR